MDAQFWAQNDRELAKERAGRQQFIQRYGAPLLTTLEQRAQQIERELRAAREQERQRAAHERRMQRIRQQVAAGLARTRGGK